jgi:hypothetical protein
VHDIHQKAAVKRHAQIMHIRLLFSGLVATA